MNEKEAILNKPFVDLSDAGLPFRMLSDESRSLHTVFDLMQGSPDEQLLDMIQTQMHYRSVGYYIASNYMVTYDGNIFCDKHILSSYTLNVSEFNKSIINHFLSDDALCEIYIEDEAVILCGFGWNQYGHWLIEILTKIFVIEAFLINLNSIKWILPNNTPQFAIDIIKLIGINESNIIKYDHENEIIKVKRLIIPTNLCRATYAAHPIFKQYAKWLRAKLTSNKFYPEIDGRIFLKREKVLNNRIITNENNVLKTVEDYGYRIISPENLSLDGQIKLFSHAISLCGAYGSALHNSLFSPDGIVVTAIRHKTSDVGLSQSSICAAHSQKMSYLFCNRENEGIYVNLDRLKVALDYAEYEIEKFRRGISFN
ncbi:glycosyltransferase family 61 protein [Acetobacter thailandicus]|uniref:Glycosyltransferase 61 family protein n=2 Tax=Acetobacter thailandicus TaxID=1502842 RepID=A0ABT3QHK8_9PROT|nr:glycosyltransferase 61 family protein [Acetobacter thailandicus]MCX2564761.1 glycosyltransferase 61 family protein [Acetobacter thailandicus]